MISVPKMEKYQTKVIEVPNIYKKSNSMDSYMPKMKPEEKPWLLEVTKEEDSARNSAEYGNKLSAKRQDNEKGTGPDEKNPDQLKEDNETNASKDIF